MFLRRIFNLQKRSGDSGPPEAIADSLVSRAETSASAPGIDGASLTEAADAFDSQGRFPEALVMLDDALARAPDDARLHSRRGATLYRWNRVHEARDASLRAVTLGGGDSNLLRQLGWCLLWTYDCEGAELWMAKAVEADPGDWKAYFGWGTTALAAGRADDALVRFNRALELAPASAETLNQLVVCHLDLRDTDAAEASARAAIAIDAQQSMAWANLGVALARQRRFDDATLPFERALELEAISGDVTDTYVNYGNCLRDAGRLDDALALYERSLPESPNANGHLDYAFTLMAVGRLAEGFREYEFRWITHAFLRRYPNVDRPAWNGQPLQGRTVLLWVEQGFGDTIQLVRYIPFVKALGATVLLLVREGLEQVLQACVGVDRIIGREEQLPPFDFHLPLMSLPRVFGTDLDSIPADVPYLRPDPEKVRHWRARLGTTAKRRVGIVWAGNPEHYNDRFRSIALEELHPVLATEGVQFVSLQKEPAAAQLAALPPEIDIVDLDRELKDFSDTVAVIDLLDLVLCVDTSVTHLAGALGKPMWILLPHPADFRWLQQREDSPWYPSARLFRQDSRRDWQPVVRQVAGAMAQWVKGPAGAPSDVARCERSAAAALCPQSPEAFLARHRPGWSAVTRARHGLVQYLPDEPFEGPALGVYGEHRQAQLEFLATLVCAGATVMEIMAGVGTHAIALARKIGPSGLLLAIEPRKVVHRILRQNLAANGARNATVLYRTLGAEAVPGAANGQALREATTTGRIPESDSAIDTLDGLRLHRLDVLKINEGADVEAIFAGAGESLWRLRPVLFVAVGDEQELGRVRNIAQGLGYRCWRHVSVLRSPVNFNLVESELFAGQTALALVGIPEERDATFPANECVEM
ncbi:MAG: tetratricopeptide repeat protein [Burkholderiales bacterium]|nr:tetratricopeptide repeat protein [Burkholderiales bacterium]